MNSPRNETTDPSLANLLIPQTLSGLFDEAFDLYKRHFKSFALLVALLYFPAQVGFHAVSNLVLKPLEVEFTGSQASNNPLDALLLLLGYLLIGRPEYGVPGLFFLMIWIASSAPLCLALDDLISGRPLSFSGLYRRALPLVPKLLTAWSIALLAFFALSIVIIFAISALIVMLVLALSSTLGPILANILFFAGLVFTYLLCMAILAWFFLFTTQLVVLEKTPLLFLWERNIQLVGRKLYRRALIATTALPLLVLGLQFVILQSFYTTLPAFHLPPMAQLLVSTLLSASVVFFLQPYPILFLSLLYYDHRVRREGFDMSLLSEQFSRSNGVGELKAGGLETSLPAASPTILPSEGELR